MVAGFRWLATVLTISLPCRGKADADDLSNEHDKPRLAEHVALVARGHSASLYYGLARLGTSLAAA
jgi:hypothetical protein